MNTYPELDDLLGIPPLMLHRMYRESREVFAVIADVPPYTDEYAMVLDGIQLDEIREYQKRLVRALEIAGDS